MSLISLWTKQFLQQQKYEFDFQEKASSSNDLAKMRALTKQSNPYFCLVSQQTMGRGRNNKKWENSDLMLSFLWQKQNWNVPAGACRDYAEDVKQALQKTWPELKLFVKAPNDLYGNKKKLAGLLLEVLSQGPKTALIAGLGLNVFSAPKNLNVGCLKEQIETITSQSWMIFLDALIKAWTQRALK